MTTVWCVGDTFKMKDEIKALTYGDLGEVGRQYGAGQRFFTWNKGDNRWEARVPDELIDRLCELVAERCPGVGVQCDTAVEDRQEEDYGEAPW